MTTRKQNQLLKFEKIKQENKNSFEDGCNISVNLGNGYTVCKIYHEDGYVDIRNEHTNQCFSHFPIDVLGEEWIDKILFDYSKCTKEKEEGFLKDIFMDGQYCGSL